MLTHLFKLIWNKRKKNFLLMTEMLVSFIILFAVFTLIVYYFQNYRRPLGFEDENVWNMGYDSPAGMTNADSLAAYRESVRRLILSMPQAAQVTFSGANTPFSNNNVGTGVSYNKKYVGAESYVVEDNYKSLLQIHLTEGRWFAPEDGTARERHIVINETLKERLFGGEDAVGKLIGGGKDGEADMKIVGVIRDLKDKGDYSGAHGGLYHRADSSNLGGGAAILIRVRPDADQAFESRLFRSLSHFLRDPNLNIQRLPYMRKRINAIWIYPLIIVLLVAGFLIINVALGLFGVLWYNISKRRGEIGLRRAVGASGGSISKQFVGEAMVLSTISLMVGSFFAVQFPLLHVFDLPVDTYLIALGLAIAFIYGLVLVCALYPGMQAARVYPAVALHED